MKPGKNQILFFAVFFHFIAAYFSIGAHQSDELFQVFEFAGYKLGMNTAAELPWEFSEQMRSGLQPLLIVFITKICFALSFKNPFSIAFLVRLLQSCFSLFVTLQFVILFEKEFLTEKFKTWFWAGSFLFWCLPYFHARFSSENFAATLFVFGFVKLWQSKEANTSFYNLILAGLLFGFSFLCRFQMAFTLLGMFGWLVFVRRMELKRFALCGLGVIIALGLGLLVDKWLYGNYTLSWWNYLDLNLFQDKASVFGREPFYFYLSESLLQLIPPFSLIIVLSILGFWYRFPKHSISWISLPFVLLHFFVAHKELRFLFPLLYFLPFMVLFYLQNLTAANQKIKTILTNRKVIVIFITVNALLLLFFSLKPASESSAVLEKIYVHVKGDQALLLYEGKDPYNNMASLHYFRNPKIKTMALEQFLMEEQTNCSDIYYFSEKYSEGRDIFIAHTKFEKIYANFPDWIRYLNFNGWLERSGTFSIYRIVKT